MGTSGEEPNKVIDATAGGLVWVRRRNGSWWPGVILGPEELPEGCVPTLRSGTPVKLLGREDASVDWYNLEKSKRVKDFHCREYENCIKKVKESATHLSKKAAKYARREDAILHALELEYARLGKDNPYVPDTPVTQDGEHERVDESPSASHPSEQSEDVGDDLNSSGGDSDSSQKASESAVSFGRPDHVDSATEESKQCRTPDSEEDDGYEGVKRMRGLEDLGMGATSSLKSKRSQVVHVHELLKRKNRHRPLTKVMASATMVSVPVLSEIKVSGLESNESKKNDSVVINNNSDSNGVSYENGTLLNARRHASDASPKCEREQKDNEISTGPGNPENGYFNKLIDVPLVSEEQHLEGFSSAVLDASQLAHDGGGARAQSSQCSRSEAVALVNEECNGSGPTSSGTANIYDISQSISKGSSEWRFKGKRNSRSRKVDNEAKTYVGGVDRESFLTAFSRNVDSKNHRQSLVPENRGHHAKLTPTARVQDLRGWSWNTPQKEAHTQGPAAKQLAPQRLLPYRQSRFTVNPKYDESSFSRRHHIAVSGLYEVPVGVKTSTGYRPQHVPYISLMSKLTGRPIIGHPLTVEVLNDGFSDDTISNSECYSSCSELDYNLSKRKSRGRPPAKPGPSGAHSSLSKSPKSRRSTLLSKKTRKLSSLTGSHRLSREEMKPVIEKVKVPSIACVPLKVVFSRINAALTSSIRPAPRSNAMSPG